MAANNSGSSGGKSGGGGFFLESGPTPGQSPTAPTGGASAQPQKTSLPLIILAGLLIPALTVYGMETMNETRVVAIVLAMLGMGIIIARPFWGLVFFMGLLFTRPEESIPAMQGMRLPLIISLVTLAAMVCQKLLSREPAGKSPTNPLIVGFGLAVVISTLPHGNTVEAVQDIAKLVILVLLIINLVNSPRRFEALINSLLVFTGYLAAYSVYLYYSGGAMAYQGMERSMATGIFADPNDLSASIIPGLALSLMRLRLRPGIFPRILYALLALVIIYAVLLTNSRGGMLALLTVIGGFLIVASRRKSLAIALAVLVAGAFLTFGPQRMTTFDSEEESANSRFQFWENGINYFKKSPVIGVGYGQFPEINWGMTAHNSFVLCFTETGMLGYFCWMGCVYYAYKKRLLLSSEEDGPENGAADADALHPPPLPPRIKPLSRLGRFGPRPRDGVMVIPASAAGGATAAPRLPMSAKQFELMGSRLALSAFLVAVFWISRTYVPVLYIWLTLPVAQQIAYSGAKNGQCEFAPVHQDWKRILLLCFASMVFIYIMVRRFA